MLQTGAYVATAFKKPSVTTLFTVLLLQLLVACGGSSASHGSTTPSAASTADDFEAKKAKVRDVVSGWDEGSGIVIRFLKESTGERLSLIFGDATAPVWKDEPGLWIIQGLALADDDSVLGHVLLGLSDLRPGSYEGTHERSNAVLAVLLSDGQWNGQDPDACWSVNPNSFFRISLRDAGDGNLVGDFQGKLVSNDDNSYLTIDAGYIYINR